MAELTKEELASITKSVTDAVTASLKPKFDEIGDLAKNQKILADTYEADKAAATKAIADKAAADAAAEAAAKAGGATDDKAKPLSAADVTKLVTDAIANDRKSQQTTAEQKAARDAFVADPQNGLAKLPDAYKAQLGSDPAKWADEAKGIAGSWEKFVKDTGIKVPNVGGVTRDGGNTPEGGKQPIANSGALPDGLATFANEVNQQLANDAPKQTPASTKAA